MIKQDLHTHTCYCDGKNTPEEMVKAAIDKGFTCIGLTGHGYCEGDEDWCMSKEGEAAYKAEVRALQAKYAGKIRILLGVEKDYYSVESNADYEHVIGSVHVIEKDGVHIGIDNTAEELRNAVEQYYNGDPYALCEDYFKRVSEIVKKTGCNLIGHFDLVTKFIEKDPLFDTENPRYKAAWKAACDALLPEKVPFEVNTGAMHRGYRTSPYPSREIREYIVKNGGELVLTSDSHSTETLGFAFADYAENMLK